MGIKISVMSYDYHGIWDEVTGLNSPLYSRNSNDDTYDKWKNANYSINYWISNGCPPEKINFGLAAYGILNQFNSSLLCIIIIKM